jgi:ribosomal protein S18 acetylase RimI-like enzyme
MDIIPASDLDIETLVDVFAQAYSDYFVPIKSDRQGFEDHLLHNDIDLGHSFAAIDGIDEELEAVGLVLSGIREERAWIGGMGIIPGQRRKGIGLALMEKALDNLSSIGIKRVQLEVIEQNEAAHALYRRLGFKETRKLHCLASELEFMLDVHPEEEIWEVPISEIEEMYAKDQCWQKELSSVRKMDNVKCLMGLDGEDVIAHAAFLHRDGTVSLLDLGGEKDTLLHHIWQEFKPVKMVYTNIPHTNDEEYLEKKGFREFLVQWEMALAL